ncbi:TonB-dependent receptor [Novosphingobium malaysiense]|uniref:TonB-dependent receptor n=1 Tax=Novosphingobium malaysiense TaxID=1348853 RepID=UPI000AE35C04|nr:TonB-dependent receptor [Novosphingobium malaysiense]
MAEAQEPPGASATEIIVTAQRRAERLENVPMSVTALSGDTIQKAGVTGIQDLGAVAPGVQVNFAGLSTQPAVRGVTTLTNGAFNENNIGIYVDGFYVNDTLSINSDLVNIKDVQVLKGPQGTLYGRNATGGAILINTLDPSPVFTGNAGFEFGRFNEYAFKGYISGPVSARVRFGLAASSRHGDGYIRLADPLHVGETTGNAAPFTNQSVRFKLQADLTDNLTATIGLNYGLADDPRGTLFTPRDHKPSYLPAPPGIATDPMTASYNYPSKTRSTTREATLTLAWRNALGTLTSRTGYNAKKAAYDFDFDGSYADFTYSVNRQKSRTFQQSLDYAINAIDGVDLLIGAFYYHDRVDPDADYASVSYSAGLTPSTGATTALRTEAYAVYADANIHVTDRLTVNVGGRYNHDHRGVTESITSLSTGAYILPVTSDSANFHKFTPRASVRYEIAPRTNIYATYSVGYRSGSYNSNTVADPSLIIPVKPETLKSWELGFKTAQDNFRFDLAGFYYKYTNYNVSLTIPNPLTGLPTTVLGNAPRATIYGIDGQLTYMPTDRTQLTIGAAWLHARYGTFDNAVGTGLNAATGLNVTQTQDWSGQQMSRAPNFSANVSASHSLELFGGELELSANLKYSDGYVISNPSLYGPLAGADLANKQRFRQGATTLLDAQINWTDPSDRYSIGVWGKNLTNEKYLATYNGTSYFGDYYVRAAPVTYGIRLGYKFF